MNEVHPQLRLVLSTLGGAAAGYVWYRTVGCSTGACPLTSNAWVTTAYGALVGLALASS